MASQNAKKKGTAAEPKYPLGLLLPIIAVLSVIPLITYMYSYETKLGKFEWYTSQTSAVDFFLHTKLIWFLVACACMIFCLVYMIFADEQKAAWCKILIPLAIYCGISFISALQTEISVFQVSMSSLNLSGLLWDIALPHTIVSL